MALSPWPIEIKVTEYKCFGSTPVGFNEIRPINLIVGRNNTGKSALVDVVQEACKQAPAFSIRSEKKPQSPTLYFSAPITNEAILNALPDDGSTRQHYEGSRIAWTQINGANIGARQSIGTVRSDSGTAPIAGNSQWEEALARATLLPLTDLQFRRITAERDMIPEAETENTDVAANGAGATNLIRAIYNRIGYDREIVTNKLLKALNTVVMPDYEFTEIFVRKSPLTQLWELELREKEKGSIPVSRSGTGLKTVLIALCNLVVLPAHTSFALDRYVFAFEELENSLHPALQRRLLTFVTDLIINNGSKIVLTTHSNVAIDMFQRDPNAQILHVTHEKANSEVQVVSTYAHGCSILDDLDVRASDLLQSNGIVWVEGPSDRIYLNKWIEMWTNGAIREGTHYQAVYYGGSLLAHLTAAPLDQLEEDRLAILAINKNAAIVMDSDKADVSAEISATKTRMAAEIRSVNGYVWVTKGREIENYLPPEAIAKALGLPASPALEQFSDIRDVLEASQIGLGSKFEKTKAAHARRFIEHIDLAAQKSRLDWSGNMAEIVKMICRWNRIVPSLDAPAGS